MATSDHLSAFQNGVLLISGSRGEVALRLMSEPPGYGAPIFVLDAAARPVDLDFSGGPEGVAQRYGPDEPADAEPTRPGRGRPRLGVVAREVTLLPRHWDWLNAQPGGASAALRRLVEEARKTSGEAEAHRLSREAAYRAMSVLAGDAPHFEAAARALFAADRPALEAAMATWPADVRTFVLERLDLAATASP